MKFTLSWLKKHLDTNASLEEICSTLTNIGLELEGLEDPAADFAAFKVAYVEKAEKHPDADKLQVCTVKTAEGTMQVVCGAPNARAGMKGIFAPEKTYIPGLDVTLKKTKIRGVESCGMLVSEREMCLSDEHEGIIEVDDKFEIGMPMAEIFGLDDPVIEINLTPNRPDCAGVYGIARDLAAAGLGTLNPVKTDPVKGTFKSKIDVKIEDAEGCPLFLGREIRGVKNGPSPEWLQTLLKAVGLRPISALVDITNFMTLGYARPLHVYDADKIKGNILVRQGKKGEEFEALNDKSYTLDGGEIAITDENGLLGLGGIVGGTSTGSEEDTVNVFLESAYFDPARIARTGRDLGVISDARYRFERGVDPEFTAAGIELATQMILEICGGEASEVVEAGSVPKWKREIEYYLSYTKDLIGIDVEAKRQQEILKALGFEIKDGKTWSITPPSWRPDVFGKADIAEEIIRIVGFDKIPALSVRSESTTPESAETDLLSRTRKARAAMAARGLNECVTWSFMNKDLAAEFGSNDNAALTLSNAISAEMNQMRPSILPNLIEAAGRNAARGFENVALCEVGPVFTSSKPEGQAYMAAGIRAGSYGDRHWADSAAARTVDLYDAKADAIVALESCGAPGANAQISRDAPEHYHPGRSGSLRLGKNVLAYFGELHPAVLEQLDVKGPVVGFEIYLENIPASKKKGGTEKPYLNLPPLQPLSRDFAFLIDENVAAEDIIRAAKAADKALITDASIFDVYQGKGVEPGKKSIALNITLQPVEQSLTDAQIEEISKKVVELVLEKTGGVLRG
ncbi:MAG: phenylalanine--tRNA ligase subunit beta [Alphaproteobacteria bacterium]|nr:phenylalanine--tRNA ligase subunit beta [Alphaproteobacteria bacterium]